MPNPTKYQPSYSFSGFQTSNPDRPLPAQRVDIELANISQTTTETINALGEIRRSDGKLQNDIVTLLSLSDEVRAAIDANGGTGGTGGGGGGTIGPQGPKGDTGPQGPKGDKGDPGSGGGGSNDAASVIYYPTPQIAVPVAQRLGMEVVLTDGYTEGSNLADFSDLIDANLARAAALRRPFVIPAGKFAVTRKFAASGVPISLFGFGPTMSVVEWQAGSASSGFDFSFDDDGDFAFFEDFGLYTKLFNASTALRASFANKISAPGGEPVILTRFQPCGRARGLVIRGTDGTLTSGFNRGIEIDAPLGFNVQDCHLWGASNGADPNYASDTAIYLGKAQGVGHPVECSIKDCRTFRWNYGIVAEGMEGVLAHFNQLVGVGVGIYFKDELSRPHFDFSHNHVNAAKVCVQVDSASQMFIQDNELFHVIGANETGYGVSISGPSQHAHICNNSFESAIRSSARFESITVFKCDHGVIDGNTFRPTVQQPGYTVDMRGITLSADARFFKVGHGNVFQNPEAGSVYGSIPGLVTKLVDYGVQNIIPGMGLDKRKRSGSQYTGPGDYTIVTFDSSEGVSGNAFAPNNPAEAIVVPVDGLWQFEATVHWEPNGSPGQRNVWITVDGGSIDNALVLDTDQSNGSNLVVQTLSVTVPLARGQVVRVMVQASNATNVMGGRWTRLAARRLA